jgi:hypothetical protein
VPPGGRSQRAPGYPGLAVEATVCAVRQIGAPALIATGLLAVGTAVADTDPEQARACLRESRELSTSLGSHSRDLVPATALAFHTGDQATTLELGRSAIHALQPGDR